MAKAKKLERNTYPAGTSESEFKCYGPVATKDTEFDAVRMADMGCFSQDGKDSNKFYHCAMVTDKKGNWYVFVQYGRQGVGLPAFQFVPCSSEAEAQQVFADQCAEKNTKRGEWQDVGGIKLYRPKKDKDLYVVRALASRTTGLPDAKNVTTGDVKTVVKAQSNGKSKPSFRCDLNTTKLMRDLLGGAVTFARTTLQGGNIPAQSALDQGRELLEKAKKRVALVGNDVTKQVNDQNLKDYTYALYSMIPKVKPLHCAEADWILSQENITTWGFDIDAMETALQSGSVEQIDGDDPMHDMPADMEWLDPKSDLGAYIIKWWLNASRNRHADVGKLTIHNLWKVNRHGEIDRLREEQERIAGEMPKKWHEERVLHQDRERLDLTPAERKLYWESHTGLTFHGTRSCNAPGIIKTGFRFPKELVNVTLNASMFGEGNYQADDYRKSCGYCSNGRYNGSNGHVKGRHSFMFACDTVLGHPYIAPGANGYTDAPKGHHCVFGKGGHTRGWGGTLQNNEWIVYRKGKVALRYLAEISW